MHYIIVQRDHGAWIVGPFVTHDAACDWARANWDEAHGDPRWQVLMLLEPSTFMVLGERRYALLPLHAPDSALAAI